MVMVGIAIVCPSTKATCSGQCFVFVEQKLPFGIVEGQFGELTRHGI